MPRNDIKRVGLYKGIPKVKIISSPRYQRPLLEYDNMLFEQDETETSFYNAFVRENHKKPSERELDQYIKNNWEEMFEYLADEGWNLNEEWEDYILYGGEEPN